MAPAATPPVCLSDYEHLAEQVLDANALAYFSGGSADEITVRWNRAAFDKIALVPRVLNGGSGGSSRIELFGRRYAHPIFVAPMALQRLAHPDGEIATAMAAEAQDAGMVLSTQASVSLEDAARAGGTCRWFQIYTQPYRDDTLALVRRAEAAGYDALVLTVDAPINGVRNREHRAQFRLPDGIEMVHVNETAGRARPPVPEGGSAVFDSLMTAAPTWGDVTWLLGQTRLPVVLKGILAPADAVAAIDAGVHGLIVSNHGGRTLDTAIASIDALPGVAHVVARRVPILLDGGIRRGTDVVKALALGASAVLIGRPVIYGLAANGPHGVAHVLRILRDEFEIAMALCGCKTIADIGPQLISR
jgi:4-hydroxymandelate oxidase